MESAKSFGIDPEGGTNLSTSIRMYIHTYIAGTSVFIRQYLRKIREYGRVREKKENVIRKPWQRAKFEHSNINSFSDEVCIVQNCTLLRCLTFSPCSSLSWHCAFINTSNTWLRKASCMYLSYRINKQKVSYSRQCFLLGFDLTRVVWPLSLNVLFWAFAINGVFWLNKKLGSPIVYHLPNYDMIGSPWESSLNAESKECTVRPIKLRAPNFLFFLPSVPVL